MIVHALAVAGLSCQFGVCAGAWHDKTLAVRCIAAYDMQAIVPLWCIVEQ